MKRIIALVLLLCATLASAQTYTPGSGQLPFYGPLRSDYIPSTGGKMLDVRDLSGPYIKSASVSGGTLNLVYQDASDLEMMLPFAPGGGLSTVATRAPVRGDGSPGDPVTIADGAIGNDKIFDVEAGKLTGTLLPARIPNLSAGKITSDTFADARLPASIARDTELPSQVDLSESSGDLTLTVTMSGGNLTDTVSLPADTVRSDTYIDGRVTAGVKDWAETGGGQVPDNEIPSGIARDTELAPVVNTVAADACVDISYAGTTLTCTQLDGGTDTVTISTQGTTDGVVTSAEFALSGSDVTLRMERSIGSDVVSNAFTLPSTSDALTSGSPLPSASAAGRALLYGDANLTSRSADGVYFRKHHPQTNVKVRMDLITSRALSPEYNIAVGFANRSASGIYGTGGAVTPSVPNGLQAILWTHHRIDSTYQWRLRVTNDLATPSTLYLDIRDRDDDTFIQNVEVVRASGETDHLSAEYATVSDLPFRHAASVHDNMRLRIRTADNQNDNSLVGLLDDGDDVMTKLSDTDDEQSTIAEGHRYAEAVRADLQANIDNLQTSADLNGKADIDLQNISLTSNEAASARLDLGLGTSATRDVGTTSGRVAVLDSSGDFSVARMPLSTMFRGEEINVAAPSNEDDTYGSTQQRIAEALAEFGLDDVTITRSINTFTVTITSPDGSTYSDAFDISTTDELSQLESLLSQLIEASGFHPDHDLVLADIINVRHLISQTITGQDRRTSRSVIDFTNSQVNVFLYDAVDGTDGDGTGLYFNTVQIADLPPLAGPSSLTLDNYGGATRVSFTSLGQPDRYVWAAGDDIVVRNVDSDATKATNWRTLFSSPDPWFSVALDADGGDIEAGASRTYIWQLLHNRTTDQMRICIGVVSNTTGDTFNTITVPSCVTYGLADINGFLVDAQYMDLRQLYDQDNGVVDVSASRNHLFVMIDRVVPNPSYSQASFVSLLIGFDFELDVSGNLVLTRRQSLDHEVLPSTNIRSIEVIAHENVNFIEDVFTFTGSYNIWHYRDPDQIQVRWENVTGKPAAASTEEMTLGTETSIRLMSPALVHQARPTQATETEMIAGTEAEVRSYSPLNIREASHYRGVYAATVTYQSGNVVFHDDVFWMARIATTGNEPLISAHQHWARLEATTLGANQLLAINDILKRIPRDITLTAQRFGPGDHRSGYDHEHRYAPQSSFGIGSLSEPFPSTTNVQEVAYWADGTRDVFEDRLVVARIEGSSARTLDGASVRFNGVVYTLEYHEHISGENRYRTTITVTAPSIPADSESAREDWSFNLEDWTEAAHESLGGTPWIFHQGAGAPVLDGDSDELVDDVLTGLSLTLTGSNLVVTAERAIGANVVSPPEDLSSLGGSGDTAVRVFVGDSAVNLSVDELRFDGGDFQVFAAGSRGVTISTIGGGGSAVDLENVATNIQPDADNTRSVGTSARTFNSGRFTNFIIDDTLHVGGDVSNDLVPDADGSHDVGTAARTWGGVRAVTILADQNMRLGTQDMGDSYVSHSLAGRELTFTQADGSTTAVTLPSGTPGGDPVVYKAHLDAATITNLSPTWVEVTQIDAANDIEINDGSFTTVTQSDTTERVCVPQAGVYEVTGHVAWEQTENVRSNPVIRVTVDGTGQSERAYSYARGIADQSFGSLEMSLLLDLAASECVALQVAEGDTDAADTADFLILADESFIELSLQQAGPAGPTGPAGTGGGTPLTESQARDPVDQTFGIVSGERLKESVDEHVHEAAVGSGGSVVGFSFEMHGESYQSVPAVSITGGGGNGATATAVVSMGVLDVTIDAAGSGYTSSPTITFSGGGATAQAKGRAALLNDGGIDDVVIESPGAGYSSAPTITFSGGGGSGGSASATISNMVTSITVTTPGTGYVTQPFVTLTGGSAATDAIAVPRLDTILRAGESSRIRQSIAGDTLVGQHFLVAPVGADEAVLYRSTAVLTPGNRNGAELITGNPSDGGRRIERIAYDTFFERRRLPADFPAHLDPAEEGYTNFQFTFQGTDTPYISVNTTNELTDWERIVLWARFSIRDGSGRTVEGLLPWNADEVGGRGDPYSAREWTLRGYLGLPRGDASIENVFPDNNITDYYLRRGRLTRDSIFRTFNETVADWYIAEDGYNFWDKFNPTDGTAVTEIAEGVTPAPTDDDYAPYEIMVDMALINAGDPRVDWITRSVVYSDAREFSVGEKDKLATAPTFAGTPSAGDVPIWNATDEEAQWGAQTGGGGGGGLSAVASDASLTGDGTSGDPLGIATDGVKLTDLDRFDAQTAVSTSGVLKNYSAAGAIGYGLVHDGEISSVAATKLTGTIANARIPSGIARDSELSGLLASGTFITSSDILRLTSEGGTNTDLNLASSLVTGVSAGDGLSGGGPGGSVTVNIDVHDVARSSPFEAQDRWIFSDEGTNNDPTSYSTVRALYNGIVDVVTTSTSAVADTDIWFFADDSQSGDPLVRIVFADLRDLILADAGGSLATTLVGSSSSLNITTANRLNATGITGWAEHDWIVVNLGGAYGKWLWVRVDHLTDLAAATDNAALSATNVLEFPDVVISNTDVYMGRTVGNELLVGASAAVNLAGFTVRGITEAEAGTGTGTNVVANPGGTPNSEIRTITVGNTDYAIAHPHRGNYDDTLDYLQGDITETGSDRTSDFWIARTDIGSGGGEPSQANLGMWWHLAGHGVWRGVLNDMDQYDIFRGDTWETDGEVWIALEDTSSRPASELNGSVSAIDVRPITNPLRIDSQGGSVIERFTESLVFRGTGIEVAEIGTTQEVEITIPMTSPIGNDTRTLSTTAWTDTGAPAPDAGQLVSISMLKGNDIVSFQVSSDILRTRSIILIGTAPTTANSLRMPVFQPSVNDADFIWLTRQVVADRDQIYVRASSADMAGDWRVDVFQVN